MLGARRSPRALIRRRADRESRGPRRSGTGKTKKSIAEGAPRVAGSHQPQQPPSISMLCCVHWNTAGGRAEADGGVGGSSDTRLALDLSGERENRGRMLQSQFGVCLSFMSHFCFNHCRFKLAECCPSLLGKKMFFFIGYRKRDV